MRKIYRERDMVSLHEATEKLEHKKFFIRLKKKTLAEIEGEVNTIILTDEANGLREPIFAGILSNVNGDFDKFFTSLLEQIKEEMLGIRDDLQVIIAQKEEKETMEVKMKNQIKEM